MLTLSSVLQLSPKVEMRPEPFGALAYHFENRKLTFLKRLELVEVVTKLDGASSLEEVFRGCQIDEKLWSSFMQAISSLVDSDMITLTDTNSKEASDV